MYFPKYISLIKELLNLVEFKLKNGSLQKPLSTSHFGYIKRILVMVWPQRKTLQLKYRVSAAKYPITVSLLVKANFKKKIPSLFFQSMLF